MSLTDAIIAFLKTENQTETFCASIGIDTSELEAWLFETISPDNIEIFFDEGVVFKHKEDGFGELLSTKWKEYLPTILKQREQEGVDTLVAMSFDDSLPPILKHLVGAQLNNVDDDPLRVNPMIAGSMMRQISQMSDAKEKEKEVRDPDEVCKNCEHCDMRREECAVDVWWSLRGVDIETKYCERFVKNRTKVF
jgi:hypothetical protein